MISKMYAVAMVENGEIIDLVTGPFVRWEDAENAASKLANYASLMVVETESVCWSIV